MQKKIQDWYVDKLDSFIGVKRKERLFIWGVVILFIVALSLPVIGAVKVIFFDQDDSDFLLECCFKSRRKSNFK